MLLPVRAISAVSGRGLGYVLKLPFRILGITAQLAGYTLMAFLAAVLLIGLFLMAAP